MLNLFLKKQLSFLITTINLCSHDIFSDENTRQKGRNCTYGFSSRNSVWARACFQSKNVVNYIFCLRYTGGLSPMWMNLSISRPMVKAPCNYTAKRLKTSIICSIKLAELKVNFMRMKSFEIIPLTWRNAVATHWHHWSDSRRIFTQRTSHRTSAILVQLHRAEVHSGKKQKKICVLSVSFRVILS